jgi:cholesterol transport system auxiliary component
MRRTILAAVAAFAAGCLGGLKEEAPPPRIYRVDAPSFGAGGALAADLKIVVGQVAPGLDGSGIAGVWPGQRLDYLAGARWADDLPALVGTALIESFQDSGRLRSVQGDLGRFQATHTLVVEVRRFEADYTGGGLPVAQVSFAATVGRDDRRVLASFTASASESATANRQSAVVAALDAAFARAAGDLAVKCLEAIGADEKIRAARDASVSEGGA